MLNLFSSVHSLFHDQSRCSKHSMMESLRVYLFLLIQALILHLLSLHPVRTLSTALLQMLIQMARVGSNPSQVTAECSCSDILFPHVPHRCIRFRCRRKWRASAGGETLFQSVWGSRPRQRRNFCFQVQFTCFYIHTYFWFISEVVVIPNIVLCF